MTENTNVKKRRNYRAKSKKKVSKEELGEATVIGAKKKESKKENKKENKKAPIKNEKKKTIISQEPEDFKQIDNDFSFKKSNLKIIPLGGIEEIGKNITLFEYAVSDTVVGLL